MIFFSRFSGDVSSYSFWLEKEEDEEEGRGSEEDFRGKEGGRGGGEREGGGVFAAEIHAAL